MREAFERHWSKVRGKKKAEKELQRHPLQPQVYITDSANRHWVTWQAAYAAGVAAERAACLAIMDTFSWGPPLGVIAIAIRARGESL